ncbi:S41 family peptidase [Chryseobacterium indoltheticum]|uniref:S41 family peptidase n=1 Tax=Chryseobacterium indoltheticum TaxID=254 RepID=UPI003F492CDD
MNVYKGKDGIAYYKMKENKPTNPKENAFKGKVYLLINGGSFSASSVISSKLKFDKRVTLVGEETGGANDGTVAGFYSYQKLPNSKNRFTDWFAFNTAQYHI